uniref:Uncharacterized protein n=1 Tax=Anguilla anguilla TaxID=7936 RepID=A0A0E9RFY0_ANGAN
MFEARKRKYIHNAYASPHYRMEMTLKALVLALLATTCNNQYAMSHRDLYHRYQGNTCLV